MLGAADSAHSACYGPVGRTDTLWLIARELRPEPSLSPQRMMLALLKANPDAFSSENVNALNAGSTLCFDESDVIEFDDHSAVAEVRRHNLEWQSVRAPDAPGAAPAGMSEGADASGADPLRSETGIPARSGGQESGSLDLGHAAAAFESRLEKLEESLQKLGTEGPGPRTQRDPELASTVEELGATLRRLLPRIARLEQEVERLRSEITNAGNQDELASLRSRVSALEAARRHGVPAPPSTSGEVSGVSELASRLDDEAVSLGLRVAHNEEQIRVLIRLLQAEGEAIEALKSRMVRSLRLIPSASAPEQTFRDPATPSGAVEKDRRNASTPAPRSAGEGSMEPMPTPAPRSAGEGSMEPMPTPAPRSAGEGSLEPMPTPAPRSAGEGSMEPMPTPAPRSAGEGSLEPMPTPAPRSAGEGSLEPMPTPAPRSVGEGSLEPMPTPAPRSVGEGAMEPMPTPAPREVEQPAQSTRQPASPSEEAGGESSPASAPEPESIDYVKILSERVSGWLARLRDLW